MIKINIVAVGKVKENYFLDAINEYSKRLSRYCKLSIIEVKEENFENISDGIIDVILEREAERIIPNLKGKVFAMAIEGKKYSSKALASEISRLSQNTDTITFVIGGSYGLSEKVKSLSSGLISFSDMTFPHTFFRVMTLEQIYRAFSIINGSSYHK